MTYKVDIDFEKVIEIFNNSGKASAKEYIQETYSVKYDPVLVTAILDRFVHHCHFVVIKGDSYSMKQQDKILESIASK